MQVTTTLGSGRTTVWRWLAVFGTVLALLVAGLYPRAAQAAPPPANSVIGNQATAVYTDATNNQRTVTSNLVQTTVQQVFSHTLTADNTKVVSPGGAVYFPHTLTNTGNGTDSYALSHFQLTTDTFNLTNVAIYADANGDGQPDNFTDISSSGPVAAGQQFKFVVAGQVPATQVGSDTAQVRVGAVGNAADPNNYAASATPPSGQEQGSLDTAVVSTGAVVNVTKAYSVSTGPANNQLTVTLTYTNSGQAAANNLVISDVIGLPSTVNGVAGDTSEMAYVSGTTKVNGVAKTDATGDDEVAFDNGTKKLTVTLGSVAAGSSGTVTFTVNVVNATLGAEKTTNVAGYLWTGQNPELATNAATYKVSTSGVASIAIGDSNATGTSNTLVSARNNKSGAGAGTDADGNPASNPVGGSDNGILLQNVPQGGSPVFDLIASNIGGAVDRMNLAVTSTGNYPAGTSFTFVTQDGVPLTDSNGDGIPDTGSIAQGLAVEVFVRVQLPPGAAPTTNWTATVTATSVNNSGISDTTTIIVDAATFKSRSVDLTNTSTTGPGVGQFSGDNLAAPSVTAAGNPGQTVSFNLWVANKGTTGDNYDLAAFGSYAVNASGADTSSALPSGWLVKFVATGNGSGGASCPAAGATVSNTGNVAGGGACEFNAVVTIPAGQPAGNVDVFFGSRSPAFAIDGGTLTTKSDYDVIRDQVTVNQVAALTLTPNGTSQIYPGGSVDFPHQLCNVGNVAVTAAGTTITSAHSSSAGFTNVLYVDTNGNGTLDTGEPLYTAADGVVAPGSCKALINRVYAPSGVTAGASDTTTLSASANGGALTATATDTVTVVTTTLSLVKKQKTVLCDGASGGSNPTYTNQDITTQQKPGACLRYQITATNVGSSALTALSISDTTPAFTTLTVASGCAPATSGTTAGTLSGISTEGATGTIKSSLASLAPGATSVIEYCVKIDQ